MSNSRLAQLIQKSHQHLLAEWVQAQLGAETMRRDLIKEDELRDAVRRVPPAFRAGGGHPAR